MRTINKIITKIHTPSIGRMNVGQMKFDPEQMKDVPNTDRKVYDCAVPMSSDGAYDRGGAYWGYGNQLRVMYTKDLSFIHFYRAEPIIIPDFAPILSLHY